MLRGGKARFLAVLAVYLLTAGVIYGLGSLPQNNPNAALSRSDLVKLSLVAPLAWWPLLYIAAGYVKLRQLRRTEALEDSVNTPPDSKTSEADSADLLEGLVPNPDGERKLREYIAAKQSVEARIGMVERADSFDVRHVVQDVPKEKSRRTP
ncbi:hypothetical protein PLCT2_01657 [Planctomycetaceae bacterium]|nr:hypothetical protein PLCT2_01657 [Planctomycetaceae bacterium]